MKRANKKKRTNVNVFSNNHITLNLEGKSLVNVIVASVLAVAVAIKLLTMSSSEVSELMQAIISSFGALAG
jgi:hypothetical protein